MKWCIALQRLVGLFYLAEDKQLLTNSYARKENNDDDDDEVEDGGDGNKDDGKYDVDDIAAMLMTATAAMSWSFRSVLVNLTAAIRIG